MVVNPKSPILCPGVLRQPFFQFFRGLASARVYEKLNSFAFVCLAESGRKSLPKIRLAFLGVAIAGSSQLGSAPSIL